MKGRRSVGIHLRITNSYTELLEQAIKLGTDTCQFFFMPQDTNKYLRVTQTDREKFLALKHKHKITIYAHSSYWINPATGAPVSARISRSMLKQEITIARTLEIDYLVVHAGSAKGHEKEDGIKTVANLLNETQTSEANITILIENTAHAGKTVCSDLQDFVMLRNLLTIPKVRFCLDTAHAYAYGYDLEATESFIKLLDQTMGLENITLLHLNDSAKPCGSKIDQHALPGQGLIGKTTLQNLINHPKLTHLPIIIEPPVLPLEQLRTIVQDVSRW